VSGTEPGIDARALARLRNRSAADDIDTLADDLPGLSEEEAARRVEESTSMTRAAIASIAAEEAEG
jgi:hypothetical protein